jgi:four helix bundle protein
MLLSNKLFGYLDKMFKFEDLNVYKESLVFIEDVYILTQEFPKEELYGLTSQLRRAAVSIALNIAEGSGRTNKDFQHFISLSRSSCYECVTILKISLVRKYLDNDRYIKLYEACLKLARMLSALKKSLQ